MLRHRGIEHRIFGAPMQTWRTAMPRGMHLKSEGFASNLYGGGEGYTLEQFCGERAIDYRSEGLPVPLDVFSAYGQEFQRRMAPHLEPQDVVHVARAGDLYQVTLADGERCAARRVVVAAGITHFAHVPQELGELPAEIGGHASRYPDPARFAGRRLAVVGAGASATDYAALAAEAGAHVSLVVRAPKVSFLGPPSHGRRSLMEKIRAPQSGLGPGWRSRLATDAPLVFKQMPASFRILVAKRHLGPAGGWWIRDTVQQRVEMLTETHLAGATVQAGGIALDLVDASGQCRSRVFDHVVAATGYRPELKRLGFLSEELRALATIAGAPALSANFESSAPGLYFTGLAGVNDFGPVVRFAFGADFTAQRLSRHLARRDRRQLAPSRLGAAFPARPIGVVDPA
jgi:cation diffusion facilitator CzcD-associated flavoprotein CzcO